ncbi:MAG: ABC transporter permease, partial [Lachnospiraceae bacterium]|nr:ABC transporter permease [Lachnospiraceae bacterium]
CVWDRVNSNFRYKEFVPLLKTGQTAIRLQNWEPNPEPNQQPGRESNQQPNLASVQQSVEIPVLACTENMPLLREEYAADGLVQFLPASLWKQIAGTVGPAEPDVYIRALAEEGAGLMELEELEAELTAILGGDYDFEMENRIQEKLDNDRMLAGYRLIIGAFCILLAAIGIANVFSNTMGFLQQRKREFARYMSVGMTPGGMKKMFFIEALVIAGRPVLITLPVTALLAGLMIKASYLNPAEFLAQAPVLPIAFFALAVFGFVALAYVIGGRRILACSLTEALRDDTMM